LAWPFAKPQANASCDGRGTDPAMVDLAQKNAKSLAAGHCFIIFLRRWLLSAQRAQYHSKWFRRCAAFSRATANPTEVILGETEQGRGILGVVDGFPPNGNRRRRRTSRGGRTCCVRSATSFDVSRRQALQVVATNKAVRFVLCIWRVRRPKLP